MKEAKYFHIIYYLYIYLLLLLSKFILISSFTTKQVNVNNLVRLEKSNRDKVNDICRFRRNDKYERENKYKHCYLHKLKNSQNHDEMVKVVEKQKTETNVNNDDDHDDEYVALIDEIFKNQVIYRKSKSFKRATEEEKEAVVKYLHDTSTTNNDENSLAMPEGEGDEKEGLNPEYIKKVFRIKQDHFKQEYNFNFDQYEILSRCLSYVGDFCAKRRSSGPATIAWEKVKQTGMVPRQASVSTYMHLFSMNDHDSIDGSNNNDSTNHKSDNDSESKDSNRMDNLLAEVATMHDYFYKPNERTLFLRIKSLIYNCDPLGAEKILFESDSLIRLRTFQPILKYYCQVGDSYSILRIFRHMRTSSGVYMDDETYSLIFTSLGQAGCFYKVPTDTSKEHLLKDIGFSKFGSSLFNDLMIEMADDILELSENVAIEMFHSLKQSFDNVIEEENDETCIDDNNIVDVGIVNQKENSDSKNIDTTDDDNTPKDKKKIIAQPEKNKKIFLVHEEYQKILSYMKHNFPASFPSGMNTPIPLAIGILEQIFAVPDLPFSRMRIRKFLRVYTNKYAYVNQVKANTARVNLDGSIFQEESKQSDNDSLSSSHQGKYFKNDNVVTGTEAVDDNSNIIVGDDGNNTIDIPNIDESNDSSSSSVDMRYRKNGVFIGRVTVNATTAICPETNAKLRLFALTDSQRMQFRDTMLKMAGEQYQEYIEKIKIKTKRMKKVKEDNDPDYATKELEKFYSWLDSREGDPYTAIVDGPNVGFFGYGHVQYSQIQIVVDQLKEMGENPLVTMPSKYVSDKFFLNRVKKMQRLAPEEVEIMNSFVESGLLYTVSGRCLDDYYWMLASVSNQTKASTNCTESLASIDEKKEDGRFPGLRPMLITNDQMRDHRLALLEPRLFRRWNSCHIVDYKFLNLPKHYDNDDDKNNNNEHNSDDNDDENNRYNNINIKYKGSDGTKLRLYPADFFSAEIQGNPIVLPDSWLGSGISSSSTIDDTTVSNDKITAWHIPVTGWKKLDRLCFLLPY